MSDLRNLVIVGSGPAAWTAAIYAARAKLNPLVLAGEQNGGQLMNTTLVENFPGFSEGIMGPELMANMRKQAGKLGVEIVDKNAMKIQTEQSGSCGLEDSPHLVRTVLFKQNRIQTKSIIIATGAVANTLRLPGEKKLMGRGVGICAVCDAPFYKDAERVFVIGGGDSAIEEALALGKYAQEVIILVRKDKMRAALVAQDYIKISKNIKIWYRSEVLEFLGEKKLEQVKISKEGKISFYSANGVFYAIGHTPAAGWLEGSGIKMDERGYIKTNLTSNWLISNLKSQISKPQRKARSFQASEIRNQRSDIDYPTSTSLAGVFAAGDCVDAKYRQAIVAAGMGAMAALDAQSYLTTLSV